MATSPLPDPKTLPEAPPSVQQDVLTRLFEHSSKLQAFTTPLLERPHATYDSLIDVLQGKLIQLVPDYASLEDRANMKNVETLDAILNAHPRLGEKKTSLSDASAMEQARLQHGAGDADAERLKSLNETYEAQFHGLRYLVFVNGRGREAIVVDMQRRISRNDPWKERMEGVTALCNIAKDRVRKTGVSAG